MNSPMTHRLAHSLFLLTGLTFGGWEAKADLQLVITDSNVSIGGGNSDTVTLTITNGETVGSNGTFSLSGAKAGTYTYTFDNETPQTVVVTTAGGSANGTFVTQDPNSLSFSADTVGNVTFSNLNAAIAQSPSISTISDTTAEIGESGQNNDTLTITTSSSFSQPTYPQLLLTSSLSLDTSASTTDPNAKVAFSSTINGQLTSDVIADASNPNPASSSLLVAYTNPYAISNTITVTKLSNHGTLDIDALSTVTPEPTTLIMALTSVPIGLLYRRRRARS